MKLILTRPLAFVDLETTGTDKEKDRIVEIAVSKLYPDGNLQTITRRINPEMPIPPEATAVHGISDEDVANEITFKQIARSLLGILEGCDMAGFNSNAFDFPFLFTEFARAGFHWDYTKFVMIDAHNIFKREERRDLAAAVMFYLGYKLEDAHSAKADIEATVKVLLAQVERYGDREDFPKTLEELALYSNFDRPVADMSGKFTYNDQGELIFNFGNNKDKVAKDFPDYLRWMVNKGNFAKDTVDMARSILDSIKK